MRRVFFTTAIFTAVIFLSCAELSAFGLTMQKSVFPEVGKVGDTVTVCLTIDPEEITSGAKADIMWVIDRSGSMGSGISTIIANINSFTAEMNSKNLDYRNGLLTFEGDYNTPATTFTNYGFAAGDAQFSSWLAGIPISGGIEPDLHALYAANNVPWRSDASKTMILITDEPVPCSEYSSYPLSLTYTCADLYSQGVHIYSISYDSNYCTPKSIPPLAGGLWLDYGSSSAVWNAFLIQIAQNIGSYTNITVRDPMPPELQPIGSACGATITGNELSWTIPSISSASNYTVCCFPAVITSSFAGSISNTAYVGADGVTETASNNEYVWYPTITVTSTITQTFTLTPTITKSMTITETITPTLTRTITLTITTTVTESVTPTITPTIVPLYLTWTGAYPNPGNVHSNVVYAVTRECDINLTVYTVSGEIVIKEILHAMPGQNAWRWDLNNGSGKRVASGVFIVALAYADEAYNTRNTVWGKVAVAR